MKIQRDEKWLQSNGYYKCPHCEKEYSKMGICSHIWRNHGKGQNFKGNVSGLIKYAGWNKDIPCKEDVKIKISKRMKGNVKGIASTPEKENLRKFKISEKMKRVGGGYRKGSGRGKSGWYKGYWCDSSWELAFVLYHLDHNIPFKRNKQGFEYIFEGKIKNFYPDFIYENGTYIEIKGRRKIEDLDRKNKAKISQFPFKLNILLFEDMEHILYYCVRFYGKNFIDLYE